MAWIPDSCTSVHVAKASGRSSHGERILRCTSSANTPSGSSAAASGSGCRLSVKKIAMMLIARRSSTTASVSRNVRSAGGRWRPMTASTASANAMSVAAGIAQPFASPSAAALTTR